MNPSPAPDVARPSRLTLDRYATDELDADQRAFVEAHLDDNARAYLDALAQTRHDMPAFDADAIRARAATPTARAPATPAPANQPRWRVWLPVIVAALIIVAVAPQLGLLRHPAALPTVRPSGDPTVRVRGEAALLAYTLEGERLLPYDGAPLAQGDTIGFQTRPAGHSTVVLFSLDGDGSATVLFPEDGPLAHELTGDGRTVPLPGTFVLDDAPGPELFIAVFDQSPADALSDAAARFEAGGVTALQAWADDTSGVDLVAVPRR